VKSQDNFGIEQHEQPYGQKRKRHEDGYEDGDEEQQQRQQQRRQQRNDLKANFIREICDLYQKYKNAHSDENLSALFEKLFELLWEWAEYTSHNTSDNLWIDVLTTKNSCDGQTIKDCILTLFEIESKWIKYSRHDITTWRPMVDPSILFLKFLLHVIHNLSIKPTDITDDLYRAKLQGVSIIVGESDNHGIFNIALRKEGTLFYKKRTKEDVHTIDEIINAINLEFDNRRFDFTHGNYSLNHVISFFCNQLLIPPPLKQKFITATHAKELYEKKERSTGILDVVEDENEERELNHARETAERLLQEESRELAARNKTEQVLSETRNAIKSMIKMTKPKPKCKWGNRCRIRSKTKFGDDHFERYQHPLYRGKKFIPINERNYSTDTNSDIPNSSLTGGTRIRTRKINKSINKYRHTKKHNSRYRTRSRTRSRSRSRSIRIRRTRRRH
jgi:hypothetical protein